MGLGWMLMGLVLSAQAQTRNDVTLVRLTAARGVELSPADGAAVQGVVQQELVFAGLGGQERLLWGAPSVPGASLLLTAEITDWTCGATCVMRVGFRVHDETGTVLFYGISDGRSDKGPRRQKLAWALREATRSLAQTPAFLRVVTSVQRGIDLVEDGDLDEAVDDIERRVAQLERSGGRAPAAVGADEEQAAAQRLKEATELADQGNAAEARAVLEALKADFPTTRAAKASVRLSDELAVIGKPAAPLTVEKWLQGAAPGPRTKATLLVFFETWCPHCRREVPRLQETHNKFAERGLAIVGLTKLTRDTTEADVAKMMAENHVRYAIAKEEGDTLSQHYGVRGIPAAAVVVDGVVVWRGHPAKLDDDKITGFLTR